MIVEGGTSRIIEVDRQREIASEIKLVAHGEITTLNQVRAIRYRRRLGEMPRWTDFCRQGRRSGHQRKQPRTANRSNHSSPCRFQTSGYP